jgi:hypothetical protein
MEDTTRTKHQMRRLMAEPTARARRTGGPRPTEPLPRLLFTREECARVLGMSLSHFQRRVQPFLRCVYSGQLRLYPPSELRRWVEEETKGRGDAVMDR